MRYSKLGKVRFVSHRDGARLWERALRRISFPVAYTEGFTPRPKLSFGLALPTGAESVAEFIDIDLVPGASVEFDDAGFIADLSNALPTGIDVHVAAETDPARGSLQTEVTSTSWAISGAGIESGPIETIAHDLLAADELMVERVRKRKPSVDDVRPLIRDLGVDPSGTKFLAELSTIGRALRPSELASAAFPGIDVIDLRVMRTHQWITDEDGQREVLSRPAVVTAPDQGQSA